jgi:hypothetical protein
MFGKFGDQRIEEATRGQIRRNASCYEREGSVGLSTCTSIDHLPAPKAKAYSGVSDRRELALSREGDR